MAGVWASLVLWSFLLGQAMLRPSVNLLGWGTTVLWSAWLLGAAFHQGSSGRSPRLAERLTPLGLAGAVFLGATVLVFPAEVLILVPEASYPWVQAIGGVLAVASAWLLARWLRRTRVPGDPPPARSGRARVRAVVANRAAVVGRDMATAAVVVVAGAGHLLLTGAAFLEAWVVLLLALALRTEMRVHRWRAETLGAGFVDGDHDEGRVLHDLWWGMSAGVAIVLTLRTTAAMGGLRPEPFEWYAVVAALAVTAAVLPYRLATRRADAVLAAWLRRSPRRRAEYEALPD